MVTWLLLDWGSAGGFFGGNAGGVGVGEFDFCDSVCEAKVDEKNKKTLNRFRLKNLNSRL
jgi:hypothetical protein